MIDIFEHTAQAKVALALIIAVRLEHPYIALQM